MFSFHLIDLFNSISTSDGSFNTKFIYLNHKDLIFYIHLGFQEHIVIFNIQKKKKSFVFFLLSPSLIAGIELGKKTKQIKAEKDMQSDPKFIHQETFKFVFRSYKTTSDMIK